MKVDLLRLSQQQIEAIGNFELSSAVYTLICKPLDGLKMEKAQEKVSQLPNLIRPLYTTYVLQSEVDNGGFNQYFWNSSGKLASEAFDDLIFIGAALQAALLKQAIIIEEKESEIMLDFKKPQTWEAFTESYHHTDRGSLDGEFYKLEKLDSFRAAHIKNIWQKSKVILSRHWVPA